MTASCRWIARPAASGAGAGHVPGRAALPPRLRLYTRNTAATVHSPTAQAARLRVFNVLTPGTPRAINFAPELMRIPLARVKFSIFDNRGKKNGPKHGPTLSARPPTRTSPACRAASSLCKPAPRQEPAARLICSAALCSTRAPRTVGAPPALADAAIPRLTFRIDRWSWQQVRTRRHLPGRGRRRDARALRVLRRIQGPGCASGRARALGRACCDASCSGTSDHYARSAL